MRSRTRVGSRLWATAHQLDGDLIGGDAGVNGLPAGEVGDDIFGDGGLDGLEP